jgi:uncharacterized damage-inducible protein DinB
MNKMNQLCAVLLAGLALGLPAAAQQDAPPTPAASVRGFYMARKNEIVRSADKMPEEFYGLRPGPQMEVRTFGQHLAHIARFNFLWCSEAKGEKNPTGGVNLEKTLHTKAEFVKALKDSFDYCDGAYNALTDASGAEIIDITQESGRKQQISRMALLVLNLEHDSEVYGSMATTMRIKSIVPGSSEPRPQPAKRP